MKVRINILSVNNGERFCFRETGELTAEADGFSVSYKLDGDSCHIEYKGGEVVQTRSGRINFKMTFSENRETECVLFEQGRRFAFPVATKSISVALSDGGCVMELEYFQGAEREYSRVMFSAKGE